MSPLADVLDAVARFVRRFVVLTSEQCDAIALWVAHTHAVAAADTTPYLWITSPAAESGKTRTLETLALLVRNPWFTGRVSPAVLVRKVAAVSPTLLLDEADAAFGSGEEYAEALRGVLNTGHRRGGQVSVCVGQGTKITYADFATFAPKALAGLRRLPDTVESRSIPIRLKRKAPGEVIEKFRRRDVEVEAAPLRQWLEDWAPAAVLDLREARPTMPELLGDRASDGWEPLVAVANMAGRDWPERATRAALALSPRMIDEDGNLGLRLLADARRAFTEHAADKLSTTALIDALCEDESAPWGDWHGRRITPQSVARFLRPFDIRPGTIRTDAGTAKGYYRDDFSDAWARWLPAPSPSAGPAAVTPSHPLTDGGLSDSSICHAPLRVTTPKSRPPLIYAPCDDVTDNPPSKGDGGAEETQLTAVAEAARDTRASEGLDRCRACGGARYWRSAAGKTICARCHPSAVPDLLVRWVLHYRGRWRLIARRRQSWVASAPEAIQAAVRRAMTRPVQAGDAR